MSEFRDDPYTRHLHETMPQPGERITAVGARAVDGLFEAAGRGIAVAGAVLSIASDSVGRLLHH